MIAIGTLSLHTDLDKPIEVAIANLGAAVLITIKQEPAEVRLFAAPSLIETILDAIRQYCEQGAAHG